MRSGRNRVGRLVPALLTAALGAAFLLQGLLLPRRQGERLEQAWQREMAAVEEIAGAILAAHPELELELAALLGEEDPAHRELGARVLSRYGWHSGRGSQEVAAYREARQGMRRGDRLFLATGLLLCASVAVWMELRRRRDAGQLAAVLDSYLSGDFSYAEATPTGGSRSLPEENLRRLGNLIRLDRARLTQEKESTKALVTDISHQLKTPIAALKTCFSLFLEADSPAERREFQDRCLLQMDKLEALTATLMNISRLEAAMITLQPEPADLRELLMEAVGGIFDKAADKNIAVELSPFQPVTLELDRRWTVEAILNVLDNAVKYSPPDTRIRIGVQQRQSFVRVEIADQGIGVPPEEHNRIFQRFYRGTSDPVRSAEGAGVGLYLTRTILESQHGSIHVRSAPGAGATFVIQLFRTL